MRSCSSAGCPKAEEGDRAERREDQGAKHGSKLARRGGRYLDPGQSVTPAGLVACGNAIELGEPGLGVAVGGRAPVAARRERAAGADLGAVGQRAALELAALEETLQEHAEPLADLGKAVAALAAPRVPGEERDLRGCVPEAQRVVQMEVLQRIRTDDALGELGRLAS